MIIMLKVGLVHGVFYLLWYLSVLVHLFSISEPITQTVVLNTYMR